MNFQYALQNYDVFGFEFTKPNSENIFHFSHLGSLLVHPLTHILGVLLPWRICNIFASFDFDPLNIFHVSHLGGLYPFGQLQHILRSGCKLSMYLRKCEFLALPEPGLDDGQMTPDSVLEHAGSMRTESGSSSGGGAGLIECPNLSCTATTEVVKKKRSNLPGCRSAMRPACRPANEISESMMNRRKGTPHRSPLH